MARLKVYRTPIGFHDAYVAAPSQKAALAAWGSDHDLFARGVAEQIDDPDLTAAPLAHPGEVVKRLRGTAAEQIAAAPPPARTPARPAAATKPMPPRPDRAAIEQADRAIAEATARRTEAERLLAAQEAALADRRRAMRADHAAELKRLEGARERAERAYADALRAWQTK